MMRFLSKHHLFIGTVFWMASCQTPGKNKTETVSEQEKIVKPVYVTDTVKHDTDDPAIWVNKQDPEQSIIIGTDKDKDGALYAFDLEGKVIDSLVVKNLQRPNNVDVGYDLQLNGEGTDFAVTGERLTSKLRFYSLPDMKALAPEGIEIYQGETGEEFRDLMGVAVYHDQVKGKHYVIAGRKNGPQDGTYLWQYEIQDQNGKIALDLVRKFGQFSGKKEIEAIAVDNELGYIYYSDEGVGVRKYYADPEKGTEELALFAREGFTRDHEGISIYKEGEKGYILVSDQDANLFHVFPREGTPKSPHEHPLIAKIPLSTQQSDGSEVVSTPLNGKFPKGLFVAMSDDRTFQLYSWEDMYQYFSDSIK